jgi:hypothetical protein
MLELLIKPVIFDVDSKTGEVICIPSTNTVLKLENSLLALSKWESIHEKPYLQYVNDTKVNNIKDKTISFEETIDYIKCMVININDSEVKQIFKDPLIAATVFNDEDNSHVIQELENYFNKSMTATEFKDRTSDSVPEGSPKRNKTVTSEMIYAHMFESGIDKSCETWNINRLLVTMRIINDDNSSTNPKKKSRTQLLNEYDSLEAQNRAKYLKPKS